MLPQGEARPPPKFFNANVIKNYAKTNDHLIREFATRRISKYRNCDIFRVANLLIKTSYVMVPCHRELAFLVCTAWLGCIMAAFI